MTDWFEVAKDITQPVDRISEIRARMEAGLKWCQEWPVGPSDIDYLLDRVEALEGLRDAALAYDAAIMRHAAKGQSWVEGDDLDALYEDWIGKARALTTEPKP
jgi:hypothetical protein